MTLKLTVLTVTLHTLQPLVPQTTGYKKTFYTISLLVTMQEVSQDLTKSPSQPAYGIHVSYQTWEKNSLSLTHRTELF